VENNKSIETVMICYENTDEWIKKYKKIGIKSKYYGRKRIEQAA